MNFITFNGYKLPIIGAKITDSPQDQREEYLRLINKVSNQYFGGIMNYYGIPSSPDSTNDNWCFDIEEHALNQFKCLLPLPTAILWLKLATKEITADNFAVDVTVPDMRLIEFKEWFLKDYEKLTELNYQYWGVERGSKFRANNGGQGSNDIIITPTMFFAYLHKEDGNVSPPVSEPVKGDISDSLKVEVVGKSETIQQAVGMIIGLMRDVEKAKTYVRYTFSNEGEHYELTMLKIQNESKFTKAEPPQPSKEELKRKEAREWLEKSTSFSKLNEELVDVLTAYKLDQEK